MKDLVKSYVKWINDKIIIRQINEWFEITTPFLNPHNDYIQIYAKRDNDKIVLSDDGVTIGELTMQGINFERSENRKNELNVILNSYGIKKGENNNLYVICKEKNFAESKHRLIQAIFTVYDMCILAEPKIIGFFLDDVINYFDDNDIRYIPNVNFMGRSNIIHQFDFSIPKSKKSHERIIKLINNPSKDHLFSSLFSFEDTQKNRQDTDGILIINDKKNKISPEIISAIQEYDISSIPFSQINKYKDILAA